MGNICSRLCPKRKKQESYDVHQQTFQMDENLGDLDTGPKSTDNRQILSNLGSDTMINEDQKNKINQRAQQQKKYVQTKIKRDSSEEIRFQKMDLQNDQEKKFIQSKIKRNSNNQIDSPQKMEQQPERIPSRQQIISQQHFKSNNQEQHQNNQEIAKLSQKQVQKPKEIKPLKKKVDPNDYRFLNQQNQFKVKKIDSLKQQQYNIDSCKKCVYFIFDITANVYIDDSQDLFVFIAPCSGSIFIRNCKNLIVISASKQFRTYQCHNCQFSIYCKTQPVIQSSSNLVFTSFDCPIYPQLKEQFDKLNLQIWNNHWSQIHNFTKKQDEKHHTLSRKITYQKEIDWKQAFQLAQLDLTQQKQIVPFIYGNFPEEDPQQCQALLIFNQQINEVLNLLPQQFTILKANQFLRGKKKIMSVALLISYKQDEDILDPFYKYGQVKIEQDQIKEEISNCFVSFGDER